jgi:cell division septation protein DedD
VSSQSEGLFRNDDPAYEPRESGAARWFRWFVYGFVGLCIAGVAVWVLSGKPEHSVPTIKGSALPDREAAGEDPARVAHQDQPIYERLAAGSDPDRGRELLPAAEQPMTREQLAASIGKQTPSAAGQGQSAVPPAKAEAVAPSEPATANQTAAAPPAAQPAARPSTAKQSNPAEPSFRIQVASVGNADQAAAEWGRISSRHPDLLSRLKGFYPEFTSSSGNTYTRVQGGPLVDKALAELLCSQLKARKVDCFVIEP